MSVVNTNIKALTAQNAMVGSQRELNHAMAQLSTGQRINSAADDAAGVAISTIMATQVSSLSQSIRNANDAVSMLQTADGAAQNVTDMLHRMKELTVQYLNGSNDPDQLSYINSEYVTLTGQISDTISNTKWNGMSVLATSVSKTFQVGSASTDTVSVGFTDFSSGTVATAYGRNLTSNSATALDDIADALDTINSARATWGAGISALTHSADNATNVSLNLSASRSRIQDTDYAQATADLARAQIVQQAGAAMLTQANQLPYMVISLLR